MNQIKEKKRATRVADIYAHIFSRAQEFPETRAAVEPPMYIDSTLSSSIRNAGWIATAVGRAMDYQLDHGSKYDWVSEALKNHMHHRITHLRRRSP